MIPVANELRVFISSTFQDLQEEREHLVKKIFPEIRALCRERGITFTEIDLRWGLTDEDVVLGQVVRTCLEEIDQCRPYFMGITGERYGHVPELHDYYKDPALLARWPWIEEAAMEGSSIIDLEFRHAVLNDPVSASASARFFFRRQRRSLDEEASSAEETQRLDDLKQRVRAGGLIAKEYRDPASLGELIYDELIDIIKRDFADAKPPTPLEQERSKHEAFAASRRRAYIPNPVYLKRLNDWFTSDEQPLILYAESGSGKSSLVSFWCDQLRRRQADLAIIEHYVGIGAGDSDHLGIIRHIIEEIKERFDRSEEVPSKPEDLEGVFANWLGFTVGKPLLVVIDGINQLSGRALELRWIPPMMPEGVKLIISSTVEQTLVDLRRRGWVELGMQPLKQGEREAMVVRFLAEYHKALSAKQVKLIADDVKCSHPLFLRTVLEELRLHGTHEHLERVLLTLLDTTGTEDLFQRVLERLEDDFSQKVVREVMALLWCARGGLSEVELAAMTGISRLKLSTLLLGLDYHLVRRDGLLTFFHDYLRRAVEKRYLTQTSAPDERYRLLAQHFERTETTLRSTMELLHALEILADRERIDGVLSDISRFIDLWKSEQYEVLRLWSVSEPSAVALAYQAGLEQWRATVRQHDPGAALGPVAALLEAVGAWPEAQALQGERLLLAQESDDRAQEAAARSRLGGLLTLQGKYEEAFKELARARDIYGDVGDRSGLSYTISSMGSVYYSRGEFDRALECFRQHETICRELGDRSGVAGAISCMGLVYADRSDIDRALESFRQTEKIWRELGDRRGLAGAIHNIAKGYEAQGKYSEAMEHYKEALEINRSVANRQWMAFNLGNMGNVCHSRGEFEESLECFRQARTILSDLGDRRGLAGAIHNAGLVYESQGMSSEAMEQYKEAFEINRSIGNRHWMANNLGSMGNAYARSGDYAEALECFREQEAISRDLGEPIGLMNSVGNMGIVYSDLGEHDEALECFRVTEEMCRRLGDRINAAGSIGNMGDVYSKRGQYAEALDCYRKAADEHRALGFGPSLCEWLLGAAQVLTELVETADDMPEYLHEYLAGISVDTWRENSIQHARMVLTECLAIGEEISQPEMLFRSRVLLARITGSERACAAGIAALDDLLVGASDDGQRAELHYQLWRLRSTEGGAGNTDDRDNRSEALRLYRLLVETTPKHDYRQRITELEHSPDSSL